MRQLVKIVIHIWDLYRQIDSGQDDSSIKLVFFFGSIKCF